jgi:hypothetical protein
MAEEDTGISTAASTEAGAGEHAAGSGPRAPGWYPARANPSDQTFWDGQSWTARRRWTAGNGWVVTGDAPEDEASMSTPSPDRPRYSASPIAPAAFTKPTATGLTFNLGTLILLVCGIALMYGSVGSWVHVSGNVGVADFHVSINGIDAAITTLISVNGWVTFIGGILLVMFAGFAMTSEEQQIALFTFLIALATTVFAVYDMFRIVQKISQLQTTPGANVSVGWGLICVLSASVLALLTAIVKLIQR